MEKPATGADTAGVVAPPPLVYVAAIVVGAVAERFWRLELPTGRWGVVVGAVLTVAAIALFVIAVLEFKRANTSPKPHEPTTAIVTSGPYGATRNPIYVSFTLAQLGIALWTRSGWILALLVPVLVVMHYGVIAREERYLERKFGQEYASYRRRVRRWA